MSRNTYESNPLPLSPNFTGQLQTRRFVFSKLQASVKPIPQTKQPNTYLEYLRATLPPTWSTEAAHIRLIAEKLDQVEAGTIDRLAIHMPPRHAKSETVTYRFPVRWLERNPTHNVLVTGYNERFARKFGRRTRNLAMERGILSPGKAAADEWETTSGGLLMTRGVGSPPTGQGFNCIIIDDPVRRRQDAESETVRESTWDWYTDDLYQRLEPGGVIVVIGTMWHEDDIYSRIPASEPGRWDVVKLPALARENDPLGRSYDAPLWPERFDDAALQRIRSVMARNEGERSFEALYQQNPTAREGTFFKPDKIRTVKASEVPAGLATVRAWDEAATPGAGDYSVGVKMSGPDASGQYYVLDVVRGQWSTDERDARMRTTAADDGKAVRIRGPQDPGSAGKSRAEAFVRMLTGYAVKTERVSGDKVTRADPMSSQVNAGNFAMVEGEWNRAFREELRSFPTGTHDDQVDAGADAFTALAVPQVRFRPL